MNNYKMNFYHTPILIHTVSSIKRNIFVKYGSFYNSPAYFTTAYFVDPKIICNTGRNEKTFQV